MPSVNQSGGVFNRSGANVNGYAPWSDASEGTPDNVFQSGEMEAFYLHHQ